VFLSEYWTHECSHSMLNKSFCKFVEIKKMLMKANLVNLLKKKHRKDLFLIKFSLNVFIVRYVILLKFYFCLKKIKL
jgi:hypothetical protein